MREFVSEFYVVLPKAVQKTINREALKAFLHEFFPRYRFNVDLRLPFADDDYGLVPLAGRVGDGNTAVLLSPAPASDVLEILDALRAFGDGSKRLH